MLKIIPKLLSPQLLSVLMEMGHGDELVLADANFPAATCAQRLVRCDGLAMLPLLDAILSLFPVDTYGDKPVGLMAVVPGDPCVPIIWEDYEILLRKHENRTIPIEYVERHDFYQRAKNAYAVIATGEEAQYANLILRKGVIK